MRSNDNPGCNCRHDDQTAIRVDLNKVEVEGAILGADLGVKLCGVRELGQDPRHLWRIEWCAYNRGPL